MKTVIRLLAMIGVVFSLSAQAELEIYKDYDLSSEIVSMTTVRIDPNMQDVYLEGLRDTWVKAVNIEKKLGHIQDWKIYASELPQSGEFNLVLMVMFKNSADLEPNQKKYNAFMQKWGEENQKKSRKIVKTYPDVRELTGEYRLRELVIK